MTGNDLKRWREKMGFTQGQLSKALEVSRQTIVGWEKSEEPLSRIVQLALSALQVGSPQVAGSRLPAAQQKLARRMYKVVEEKDDSDTRVITRAEGKRLPDKDRYLKIVEWSPEDQTYIGSAPGLMYGGCHGPDERQVFDELCLAVEEQTKLFREQHKSLPPATIGRGISEDIR